MSATQPMKSQEEIAALKNYYRVEKPNIRNLCLITIGLNTALRISDLLSVRWQNVYNFKARGFRKHLYLKEQKTGKPAAVAINESVRNVLSEYLEDCGRDKIRPDWFLFSTPKNRQAPISRIQAYRIIREASAHIGAEVSVSCHSLRKTFGYQAWKQGVSPVIIMNIYNHSSYQITKRYLCIDQDEKDAAYHQINL